MIGFAVIPAQAGIHGHVVWGSGKFRQPWIWITANPWPG
jgi:hypothetical protein